MKIDPANLDWKASHELLVGCIVPRPIAFVSTVGKDGVFNVAPFSFFTGLSMKPMILGFNAGRFREGQKKDTLVNIEFTKDFVVNIVPEALGDAQNQASERYPSHVDEFKEVDLTPAQADIVKSPMVAESPVNLECRLTQILEFGSLPRIASFIIGEVVLVHTRDELYVNDAIDMSGLKAIARMGGEFYCRTRDIFELKRPEPLA